MLGIQYFHMSRLNNGAWSRKDIIVPGVAMKYQCLQVLMVPGSYNSVWRCKAAIMVPVVTKLYWCQLSQSYNGARCRKASGAWRDD